MVKPAVLASTLLLVVAPAAEARWPRAERAKAAALAHWNESPACAHVWTLKADELPGLEGTNWLMAAAREDCTVYVRRSWLTKLAQGPVRRVRWLGFCTVYVHEWGHLLGWRDPATGDIHSDDQRSVMYPNPLRVPRTCRRG